MIGVVVVSHGQLAKEFVAAAEHVLGPQSQMLSVSIGPDDDMEVRRRDILDAVKATDDGSGVIILTDMFGGTPSNLAISLMGSGQIEVIAGINLPMLIRLAGVRKSMGLREAAKAARDSGRSYITIASEFLGTDN